MPGWEKVKLKINDYEAVDHKKAYLKENIPLKSTREERLCPRLDRLQLYRRHIGKRGGPEDEETTGSGDENGVSFVFMDMRTTSRR